MDSLDRALLDINRCIINDSQLTARSYYWRGIINKKMNKKDDACHDFQLALEGGVTDASFEIMKYCNR